MSNDLDGSFKKLLLKSNAKKINESENLEGLDVESFCLNENYWWKNGADNLSQSRNVSPNDCWMFKDANGVNPNIVATYKKSIDFFQSVLRWRRYGIYFSTIQ